MEASKTKTIILSLAAFFAVGVAVAGTYWTMTCPCERVPGGYLVGEAVEEEVSDWSFVNSEPLCQIEVGNLLRHSVNLNCMSFDGGLYLSCANCEGKRWSTIALDSGRGRIRVGDNVYPVSLEQVTDPDVLDAAWQARADKLGRESTARADGWWSFRLNSI